MFAWVLNSGDELAEDHVPPWRRVGARRICYMLYHIIFDYTILYYNTLCHVMLCYAVL